MGRPAYAERREELKIYVPKALLDRIRLVLYSPTEERVPHGALTEFYIMAAQLGLERLAEVAKQQENTDAPHP